MFIRLFMHTNNEEECKEIFYDVISDIAVYIDKMKILSIKPYWKIEERYVLEVRIRFKVVLSEEIFRGFLDSISDKWTFFGDPIEGAIASQTTPGCKYLKNNVTMIDITFKSNEILIHELGN